MTEYASHAIDCTIRRAVDFGISQNLSRFLLRLESILAWKFSQSDQNSLGRLTYANFCQKKPTSNHGALRVRKLNEKENEPCFKYL
jgi:hypothetical protein